MYMDMYMYMCILKTLAGARFWPRACMAFSLLIRSPRAFSGRSAPARSTILNCVCLKR